MNNRFVICIDMDGVLCDFDTQFINYNEEHLTPIEFQNKYGKKGFYNHFKNISSKYWSKMSFMPKANILIDSINNIVNNAIRNNIYCNIVILTTPMPTKNCIIGKTEWVQYNLTDLIYDDVFINKSLGPKGLYVEYLSKKYDIPNTKHIILIDDFQKNINSFNNCGGIGILYNPNNIDMCIDKLTKLIFNNNDDKNTN